MNPAKSPRNRVADVSTPVVISACFNLVAAGSCLASGAFFTCVFPVLQPFVLGIAFALLSIPLVALAICEFVFVSKLAGPAAHPRTGHWARMLSIAEMYTILVGNLPSAICGLFVFLKLAHLESALESRSR
ncbi:MAG: hypothetical protein IT431_11015 [Phycisphaerales bacterium]|nr:hypothetical protein [Phycisphaerales bacterium]